MIIPQYHLRPTLIIQISIPSLHWGVWFGSKQDAHTASGFCAPSIPLHSLGFLGETGCWSWTTSHAATPGKSHSGIWSTASVGCHVACSSVPGSSCTAGRRLSDLCSGCRQDSLQGCSAPVHLEAAWLATLL